MAIHSQVLPTEPYFCADICLSLQIELVARPEVTLYIKLLVYQLKLLSHLTHGAPVTGGKPSCTNCPVKVGLTVWTSCNKAGLGLYLDSYLAEDSPLTGSVTEKGQYWSCHIATWVGLPMSHAYYYVSLNKPSFGECTLADSWHLTTIGSYGAQSFPWYWGWFPWKEWVVLLSVFLARYSWARWSCNIISKLGSLGSEMGKLLIIILEHKVWTRTNDHLSFRTLRGEIREKAASLGSEEAWSTSWPQWQQTGHWDGEEWRDPGAGLILGTCWKLFFELEREVQYLWFVGADSSNDIACTFVMCGEWREGLGWV